jgi:cytochrome bd-type quinol oxidase subunit 1
MAITSREMILFYIFYTIFFFFFLYLIFKFMKSTLGLINKFNGEF